MENLTPETNSSWPEGWFLPEPISLGVMHEENWEGEATTFCYLCEWCNRRPEFHELNHDLNLCRRCAFEVAPTKPLERYGPVQLTQHATRDSPRDLSRRLAILLLELLLASQGGVSGYDPLEGTERPGQPDTVTVKWALIEAAELTFTERLPFYKRPDLPDEEDVLYAFVRRRAASGAASDDPYLSAFWDVCLSLETPYEEEARTRVLWALGSTLKHLEALGGNLKVASKAASKAASRVASSETPHANP